MLTLRLHMDVQGNSASPKYNPLVSIGSSVEELITSTMTSTISRVVKSRYESEHRRDARELEILEAGLSDLEEMGKVFAGSGYDDGRIIIDTSVIRGLEYYTGPVFEAELTFEVKGDDGQPVRFGSVGGGGRYDDLVSRFTGEKVPATGFSIGVSRLQAALAHIGAKPASSTRAGRRAGHG